MFQLKKTSVLRELILGESVILAPGAYDCVSAKIIEAAGFDVCYITGFGIAASVLGKPDWGFVTMTEMVERVQKITEAVTIPVIADGDTGYGNPLNVMRTVAEFEKAGASAIQLEDQVFPKKCGHMEGKQVVQTEEMVKKIKAALAARKDENFLIIARTDARAVLGLEEAIKRGQIYAEAGADIIFVEAPQTHEELAQIAGSINKPLVANMVERGKTPLLSPEELKSLGYKLVVYPVSALFAATRAIQEVMKRLKAFGGTEHASGQLFGFGEFNRLVAIEKFKELEEKFV